MEDSRHTLLNRAYLLWGVVLILWALYRVYTRFPEWVDEFSFKPLIFVIPAVFIVIYKERRPLTSLGLSAGKFFRDIYLGLGFGMLFAIEGLVANSVKYGKFSFAPMIKVSGPNLLLYIALAIAGAISEEILIRGFLYNRLKEGYGSEVKAMLISTTMYFIILLPSIFIISKLMGPTLLIFLMTNLILSLANTMIFNETKTITVPVLIHAFWNMAVALYL